ncbi:hypothetical protein BDW75DRAFT_225319 [Aspergillus navahoensis]
MGEGEGEGEEGPMPVSQGEAEAFATQRNCLFVEVSRRTGRGVCDAVGSLVERAYGARGNILWIRRMSPRGIRGRRY